MKRRLLALPIVVAVAGGLLMGPAGAHKANRFDVPTGKECADIVQGDAWYRDTHWTGTNPPATPTVFFLFTLAQPSCAPKNSNRNRTKYRVKIYPVYSGVADLEPAITYIYTGDGVTQTFFSPPGNFVLPADPRGTAKQVCIVVVSGTNKGETFDVAPDAGCAAKDSWVILNDSSGGGSRGWY